METDRHPSDGASTPRGERTAEASAPGGDSPAPAASYDYGDAPATPGAGAADAPTAADAPEGTDAPTDPQPLTAPRAVLRPVPEGFPTPPPRPARPNRRPAPREEPAPASPQQRRRRLVVGGIALAAVLALLVLVGGGILAYRALSPAAGPEADPAATQSEAGTDTAEPGTAEIGEAVFTEVSTEVGVRSIGGQSSPLAPEGEFVIITFEVENPGTAPVEITENLSLVSEDDTFAPDREASRAHISDSASYGLVPSEESGTFHAVFDVPIGTRPTGLHIDLAAVDGGGTLPLTP